MALTNVLLLSQIAGYVIAFILSLCIVVPMSFHQEEFRATACCFPLVCGKRQMASSACSGPRRHIATTPYLWVCCCSWRLLSRYIACPCFLYKGTDSSFLSAFIDVVANIFLCAMVVLAAMMITLGFLVWCDEMTQRFPSCEVAAGKAIDKKDGINTSGFYIEMGTAQFGAWASWACWVGLTVFAILKLCRYHQLENMRREHVP